MHRRQAAVELFCGGWNCDGDRDEKQSPVLTVDGNKEPLPLLSLLLSAKLSRQESLISVGGIFVEPAFSTR